MTVKKGKKNTDNLDIESKSSKKTVSKKTDDLIIENNLDKQAVSKNTKNSDEETFTSPSKHKIYYSFAVRVFFSILLFLVLLFLGVYFLTKSIYYSGKKSIIYHEKSNVDYSVCLLDNQFYDEKCLKKNMKYVASLIDKINLKFNYTFDIEEEQDIDFTYDIYGKLVISDKLGEKSYYEKTYDLLSDKVSNLRNSKTNIINETLDIDYSYYNRLANGFKSAYGLDTTSKLVVYMTVKKAGAPGSNLSLNNDSVMFVSIPLSERSIDIELNYKDINTTSSLISKSNVTINNLLYILISALFIVFSIIVMLKMIKKFFWHHNSEYDNYINKILKKYDRLIGESYTMVSFEGKEVVKFEKFTELLDVHDNLGLPIMHYTVTCHVKSYFYIVHENVIYLHVVKAVDLEM